MGLAPVAGYNRYDDLCSVPLIHNINLPANKFEFLFTPLYAFGSKKMVGLGRMSYSWHPDTISSAALVSESTVRISTLIKPLIVPASILFENF